MAKYAKVKVMVATHKACSMPSDSIYIPIHVGAEGKLDEDGTSLDLGFTKDNTGDNISEKNPCFGTQTALYWGWKNLECDYLGLVHYRRFLLSAKQSQGASLHDGILTEDTIVPMLESHRVLLPKRRHYYIETVRSHYSHTMNGGEEQLRHTRDIIAERTPEYMRSFEVVMRRTSAYIFNMMVMERNLIDDYCSWLFPVLFELEQRVDTAGMSEFDRRYMGRVSERLLNVWLERKLELGELERSQILELPYTEDVNWRRKISSFARAKFLHRKYEQSF